MKKRMIAILSVLLVMALACSVFIISTTAATPTINYTFSGSNAADRGFAEGTITLSGGSGTTTF